MKRLGLFVALIAGCLGNIQSVTATGSCKVTSTQVTGYPAQSSYSCECTGEGRVMVNGRDVTSTCTKK